MISLFFFREDVHERFYECVDAVAMVAAAPGGDRLE
jgi:hypothetical protein